MEFIKTNQFRPLAQAEKKQTSKAERRTDKVKVLCCKFHLELETLLCGLSDGTLILFSPKKFSKQTLTASREYDTHRLSQFAHKGEVRCVLMEKIFNQVFIISGSADRTIKIWENDHKAKDIVQMLTGHSGTILTLAYSRKTDTLFSGSTDKTLRIWKQDEGRKLFLYPWYICYQTIIEFSPRKTEVPIYPTALQLHDGQVSNFSLYIGDSAGSLHVVKQVEVEGAASAYDIQKSNYACHRLSINCICYVSQQHLVITCGYDQFIYAFEALSNKLLLKFANPRKCIFTSLVWTNGMLVAADEEGVLYCIELNSDRAIEQIRKYNTKIGQLGASRGDIFVLTSQGVDSVRLVRGIKAVEGENCHTAPIVAMFALQTQKLTEKKIKDQAKIITVSLDHSMRVWDPASLTCIEALLSPEKTEISSFYYLKRANLFVTGHDNGTVRLWNIELQTSITVTQENIPYAHSNTVCCFTSYIYVRSNEDVAEFMFSTGYEGRVNVWEIFLKKNSVQSSLMSSTICPQLKFSFYPDDLQQSADQVGSELFALALWNRDGEASILSGGAKGMVYFSRMFSYETYRKIKIHDDSINAILIDEHILFTAGGDITIKLTSLDTFEQLIKLVGHDSAVASLQLIEQTGHLISRGDDGEVILWDYPQQRPVKKLKEKKQKIISVCVVGETQMLYAGTEEATIVSYSLKEVFASPVSKGKNKLGAMGAEELDTILKNNQAELDLILKEYY